MTVFTPSPTATRLSRWADRTPWRRIVVVAVASVVTGMTLIPVLQGPAAAEALTSLGIVALLVAGISYVAGRPKADCYALAIAVALGTIGADINLAATAHIVAAAFIVGPTILIARWLTYPLTDTTTAMHTDTRVARVYRGTHVCEASGTGSCPDYGPGLDLVDDEHRCALDAPHDDAPHECLCGATWNRC